MRALLATLLLLGPGLAGPARGQASAAPDPSRLVGRHAPKFRGLKWVAPHRKLSVKDLRGKVAVIRWWTDGCPYCVVSVGALNRLHGKYGTQGVAVIGIYFPSEKRKVNPENIRAAAELMDVNFPVAIDAKWKSLERWWLREGMGGVTTPTFVLDHKGVVRAIHADETIGEADASRLEGLIQQLQRERAQTGLARD